MLQLAKTNTLNKNPFTSLLQHQKITAKTLETALFCHNFILQEKKGKRAQTTSYLCVPRFSESDMHPSRSLNLLTVVPL